MTTTQFITLALSGLLILSYLYSVFANRTKFPSIILLIFTGLGIAQLGFFPTFSTSAISYMLQILGTIGLIFIILEAVIDIKIKPDNIYLIRKALTSSSFLFLTTASVLAFLIFSIFECTPLQAFIYATPLAVVSSAVAIPSVEHLRKSDRVIVTYETAFSDIIGVLLFNFLIVETISVQSIGLLGIQTIVGLGLSVIVSFGLIFVMTRVEEGAVYALILAALAFLYTLGKILHLPSLLLILVFGILVNNRNLISNEKLQKIYEHENYLKLLRNLKIVVIESTFVVRTFFFFIFGYSISLSGFHDIAIWLIAAAFIAVIYSLRFGQLKLSKDSLSPHLVIVPRGLITIMLFYSIPDEFHIKGFDTNILTIIVLTTCLVMAFGLIHHERLLKKDKVPELETFESSDDVHHLQ